MGRVRAVRDLAQCRRLWQGMIPAETFTDLWEVRETFHRHYRRPVLFLVHEEDGRPDGLLPLAWIEEAGSWGYFPGETHNGRTWLEQNRIIAADAGVLERLLDAIPGPYHLRYLRSGLPVSPDRTAVDETGYLFCPPDYGFDMENYFDTFTGKKAKRLRREVAAILDGGTRFYFDRHQDFDTMVRMNAERYEENSYFADPDFRESFRDLFRLFRSRRQLRSVTITIDGVPAAVDYGVVYGGRYTLLAGGTDAGFPGVAKAINLHHMGWACENRLREVDFLCGDFNWKILFHLKQRPLFLMSDTAARAA